MIRPAAHFDGSRYTFVSPFKKRLLLVSSALLLLVYLLGPTIGDAVYDHWIEPRREAAARLYIRSVLPLLTNDSRFADVGIAFQPSLRGRLPLVRLVGSVDEEQTLLSLRTLVSTQHQSFTTYFDVTVANR